MKKCISCQKDYDDSMQFCEICGKELVIAEEITDNSSNNVEEKNEEKVEGFCIYCGGQIVPDKGYCSRCGKSAIVEGQRHCTGCGQVLSETQKFCAKCGQKVSNIVVPKSLDEAAEKVKKVDVKKFKRIVIAVGVLVVVFFAAKAILPKVFVSSEQYLIEGNYTKAYEKAKKDGKEAVLVENLIAHLCAKSQDSLKDPDSFKLRDAWYDEESDRIVLKIQGKNSYGGDVSNYWYFTFEDEDQEYQLWTTVSDFEEEEVNSWDDYSEKFEKLLENAAKETISEIINEKDYKLDKELVERINGLKTQDILEDVELLEETKTLYPEEAATET